DPDISTLLWHVRAGRGVARLASGVASCSLAEHEEATRPHWAIGLSGSYTNTRLRFSGGVRGSEARYGTQASLAYLPTARLVLQAGVGLSAGGELVIEGERYEFLAGPLLALAADYRVFDAGPVFVLATSSLSFSATRTQLADAASVPYRAFDLRLDGQLGVEVARVLWPYVLARVFGGTRLLALPRGSGHGHRHAPLSARWRCGPRAELDVQRLAGRGTARRARALRWRERGLLAIARACTALEQKTGSGLGASAQWP
ncbi:MAG: hypothetical protein ABIQ16_18310, partial [Polyangiaceae bacterium]